jgi:hypothetical protein
MLNLSHFGGLLNSRSKKCTSSGVRQRIDGNGTPQLPATEAKAFIAPKNRPFRAPTHGTPSYPHADPAPRIAAEPEFDRRIMAFYSGYYFIFGRSTCSKSVIYKKKSNSCYFCTIKDSGIFLTGRNIG